MSRLPERILWLAVSGVAAIAAQKIVQRSLDAGWEAVTHRDPPDERAPTDELATALTWAAITSALVAVVEFLARRGAQKGWRRATGHDPPA